MNMSSVMRNYIQQDEDIRELYGGQAHLEKRRKWLRNILITFLFIVLVGGLAILGIGIWTLEAEYGSKQLSKLINEDLYKVDSYLMIITGSAIIAITLLGFCGVLTRYKCIMSLHLGFLAFMSVMLFVAGILGYVLLGELENKVKEKMEDVLKEEYGIPSGLRQEKSRITSAWDDVQQTFECCGAYGDANSSTSWALYKKTQWYIGGHNNQSLVPKSCCKKDDQYIDYCTGKIAGVGPPTHGPPVDFPMSSQNYTLFSEGCFDALETYLSYTGVVIGSCAIVVGVFMLVELVLSICMYRTMRDH